ncbi:S-layer homology domain-containing protein, partial [Synechococcus sp. CS-197]|uniref:S-layer homology domain-containing protein n=1 Tax=Synechococcus sp. CS-197 TaxID=2847985 RepID=UPI00223B0573
MQRMILASTALVVFAPVSVEATDVIGDSLEQVTSITQFSDVYPTDWAYQALSNLIERYGCVAGYPNGTYRGNRAMTR